MLLSYIVTDVVSHIVFFVGRCYALFIMIWQMLLPMFETVVISHSLICGTVADGNANCFGYHFRLMH